MNVALAATAIDDMDWMRRVVPDSVGVARPATVGDRTAEHTAGRDAATAALRELAAGASAVGRADDGRPLWPDGTTGSISHGAGLAVAVVAPQASSLGLGVDIEAIGALPWDDAASVFSDDEVRAGREAGVDPTVVWSVKEAAFKAWSHAADGLPPVDPREIVVDLLPGGVEVLASARGSLGRHLVASGLAGVASGQVHVGHRIIALVKVG